MTVQARDPADTGEPIAPVQASHGEGIYLYGIRVRTLIKLVAGRGSFRLAQLLANVALLPLWGERRYGVFAAAVASFTWLIPLLQAGPEKTVLKLLPRAPRTGPQITEAMVGLLWCLPVPALAAFGLLVAAGVRGTPAIYLGVVTMAIGSGSTLVLAGLHRVNGRPYYDFRSAFAMSFFQLIMIGLVFEGLGPLGYIACFVGAQTVVNMVMLVRLGRPSLRIRRRRGFLWRVVWTVVLMGSPEVCLYMCTSVWVAMLAVSRFSNQVGQLFVVALVWSAGITFVLYALRVYAPRVSVRLHGRAAGTGHALSARLARIVVVVDVVWLLALVVVTHFGGLLAASEHRHALYVWIALDLSRTPAVVLLLASGFLLENSDAKSTRITGVAAPASLVAATIAGFVLIFPYGGIGLGAAGAIAEIVQALVIAVLISRKTGAVSIRAAAKQAPASVDGRP